MRAGELAPYLARTLVRVRESLKKDPRLIVYKDKECVFQHAGSLLVQNDGPETTMQGPPLSSARGILGTVRSSQTHLIKQAVVTLVQF